MIHTPKYTPISEWVLYNVEYRGGGVHPTEVDCLGNIVILPPPGREIQKGVYILDYPPYS